MFSGVGLQPLHQKMKGVITAQLCQIVPINTDFVGGIDHGVAFKIVGFTQGFFQECTGDQAAGKYLRVVHTVCQFVEVVRILLHNETLKLFHLVKFPYYQNNV